MVKSICTVNDTLRERLILGAELTGKYDFPVIDPVIANVDGLKSVPINYASKERNPRNAMLHMFVDDYKFDGMWSTPDKMLATLRYFKFVCAPDFSVYGDMPKILQIYNVYRNRALTHYLSMNGVKVIPTVTWSTEESYEFCFDGLPTDSTLAISTNGCHTLKAREYFIRGFNEMCDRLKPCNIVIVGGKIDTNTDIPITYMNGYSQDMAERAVS